MNLRANLELRARYGAAPEETARLEADWAKRGLLQPKLADAEHKLHGHLVHQELRIAVENRKGSVRSGVDADGKPWKTKMVHPYGYLVGTKGKDGEEVDAYVGPKQDAPNAYVVHQRKHDGTGHDEDKIMLGFASEAQARAAYLKHYNDPKFLGPISTVPIERLKALIAEKKPLVKISGVMQAALLEELVRIQQAWSAA
jgi:hypothetical protein